MGGVQIVEGSFSATTAEASSGKNLELGFTPLFSIVWNEDAVTGEDAVLMRFGGQSSTSSLSLKMLVDSGSTGSSTVNDETSNGLSDYNAASISAPFEIDDLVSADSGNDTTVSTTAAQEHGLVVGDNVFITNAGDNYNGNHIVKSVTDTTNFIIDKPFTTDTHVAPVSGNSYQTSNGVKQPIEASGFKGLVIPSNIMTTAGDVIRYVAFGSESTVS